MPNKYKHLFRIFAILAITEAIILFTLCSRNTDTQVIEHHTSDTIKGDSIPYEVIREKPVPMYIDTGQDYYWYYPVDTLAILKDYFAKVVYLDTLKDDSSAFIAILDCVSQNRLQSRKLYFANRKITTIHNTTYTEQPDERIQLYAGAMLATMPDKINTGPVILMTTPKGMAYSYAYGINAKSHTFTFTYRLKLFNRKIPPD